MAKAKYSDAKVLQEKIDEYFSQWDDPEYKKPMTFSGLAYFLGFCQRQSLNQYADKDNEMSIPIKRAMLRIEQDYEEGLRGKTPTGSIFGLKNRGWTDKQEHEHSFDKDAIEALKEAYGYK